MTIEQLRKLLDKDPFRFTKGVQIETTNRCNYSSFHPRCPISKYKEKKILPMHKIKDVLHELEEHFYSGTIFPFNYGEPLIDPRMFSIIGLAKMHVPNANVSLYTNGFMVDENMIRDLSSIGLDRLNISIYNPEDGDYFHRMLLNLRQEKFPMVLRAYQRYPMEKRMNDKLDWYDNEPNKLMMPCSAPYSYILINADGNVGLCCHDWKNLVTFGSVYDNKLVDIIKSEKAMRMFLDLRNSKRDLYYLCARCSKHR